MSDGKGGACEMMVWLVKKARMPACCHSQRSRHTHVEYGVKSGGECCDWMRVVKGKEKRKSKRGERKSGKSIQKLF